MIGALFSGELAKLPTRLLLGVRVQGLGFQGRSWDRDLGFRVQGSGVRVQGSRFRVQGSGFKVQGSGFRVQDSGFRVQGLGFGVSIGLSVANSRHTSREPNKCSKVRSRSPGGASREAAVERMWHT